MAGGNRPVMSGMRVGPGMRHTVTGGPLGTSEHSSSSPTPWTSSGWAGCSTRCSTARAGAHLHLLCSRWRTCLAGDDHTDRSTRLTPDRDRRAAGTLASCATGYVRIWPRRSRVGTKSQLRLYVRLLPRSTTRRRSTRDRTAPRRAALISRARPRAWVRPTFPGVRSSTRTSTPSSASRPPSAGTRPPHTTGLDEPRRLTCCAVKRRS